jgi:hypothetical protein
MATCAEIVNSELPETAGEDSVSMLPLFKEPGIPVRDTTVHHSISGKFAIENARTSPEPLLRIRHV